MYTHAYTQQDTKCTYNTENLERVLFMHAIFSCFVHARNLFLWIGSNDRTLNGIVWTSSKRNSRNQVCPGAMGGVGDRGELRADGGGGGGGSRG